MCALIVWSLWMVSVLSMWKPYQEEDAFPLYSIKHYILPHVKNDKVKYHMSCLLCLCSGVHIKYLVLKGEKIWFDIDASLIRLVHF